MNNSTLLSAVPYIIAFSTGLLTVSSTIFLFIRFRTKLYLYLSLMLFSMLSKLLNSILKIYFNTFALEVNYLLMITKTIKALGFSVLLFILPVFISYIMLIKIKTHRIIIFAVISLIPFCFYILKILSGYKFPYSYLITNLIFISVIIYSLATVILNFKDMTDKRKRKIIITFLALALVFLPLFIIDIISGATSIQLPVYFIIVNILSILFCFFYLIPPLALKKEQITDFLQRKYNITDRENEIISLIKRGYSNNEICSEISISVSTVEKHINSIYRKLNIKNRVQLVNLLQSGMQ